MNPFTEHHEYRPNRFIQPVSIPLARAYFCPDCERIHISIRCPECGNVDSFPLQKWLGSVKEASHA